MLKPLVDKIFFADKVDATVFVDYGCADGAMIKMLGLLFPEQHYIGYDVSQEMLESASRQPHAGSSVFFSSDWTEVEAACEAHRLAGRRVCLVLSSVIHEARNYLSSAELDAFWRRVWGLSGFRFDAIAIRDMMVNRATSRPSDSLQVALVRQRFDPDKLSEWERQWGSISENWSLMHFLLTYRYTDNWSREVKENYLPTALEDLMGAIPREYIPVYEEHFTLPFLRRKVWDDFRIQISDRTHLKLILELDRNLS